MTDTSAEGVPTTNPLDLLKGAAEMFISRLQVPSIDKDVGITIGRYKAELSRHAGVVFGQYASQAGKTFINYMGDAAGTRVIEVALTDGRCDIPSDQELAPPPYVHQIVDSVGLVAAEICEGRQLLVGGLRQHVVVAQSDQGHSDNGADGGVHPKVERWAAWAQRLVVVPICVFGFMLAWVLGSRVNGWPSGASGSGQTSVGLLAVPWFAGSVVLLGMIIGLFVSGRVRTEAGGTGFIASRPATVGAGLSAAIGALFVAGGVWQIASFDPNRALLALLVWMAIAVVAFVFVFVCLVGTQTADPEGLIPKLFTRYIEREAERREHEADELIEVAGRLHNALLRETQARGLVFVDRYYQANLWARRNSRSASLTTFIEEDIARCRQALGRDVTICICDLLDAP